MPTIDYKPMDLSYLVPGISPVGGGSVPPLWERLGDKDRWLATTYSPSLFSSVFGNGTAAVGALTNAASGSPDTLGRWIVMGNASRRPVVVSLYALVNNSGTTGTLTVTYGGGTTTQAVTATSATSFTVTVTPTTGTAPLELKITGHTDDSNYLGVVCASGRLQHVDRYDGGIGSDGYTPLGDAFNTASYSASSPVAANKPISTELVSRGWNNVRAIARDRVACLATLQRPQNVLATRPWWATDAPSCVLSGMLWVPPSDTVVRDYRLSWYTLATGDAAGTALALVDGSQAHEAAITTSGGWTHDTITLPPNGGTIAFNVQKDSGAGLVGVTAAQVFREP